MLEFNLVMIRMPRFSLVMGLSAGVPGRRVAEVRATRRAHAHKERFVLQGLFRRKLSKACFGGNKARLVMEEVKQA